MTLMHIRAQFQCDGCGRAFIMEMNPEDKPAFESLFEEAVDYLRGGFILRYADERKEDASGIFASVQDNQHLCPACTTTVDDYTETVLKVDRDATEVEIAFALSNHRMFKTTDAVNQEDDEP